MWDSPRLHFPGPFFKPCQKTGGGVCYFHVHCGKETSWEVEPENETIQTVNVFYFPAGFVPRFHSHSQAVLPIPKLHFPVSCALIKVAQN